MPPSSATALPVHLLAGPATHGVNSYALEVVDALRARGGAVPVLGVALDAEVPAGAVLHLHVTERLIGPSPEEAAERFERWAASATISVTLHDLPQPSDGERNLERRSRAYARIVAAARGVAVNSRHEAALLEAHLAPLLEEVGATPVDPAVIPLGTRVPAVPEQEPGGESADRLTVLLAGYVYPGKGHAEAIAAAARVAPDARVLALGGASAGHERDVDALAASAEAVGVHFEATGYLDDHAYRARCAGPGIPLAAHRHVSASRTLLDWVEQGRRPIVADSRYAREMAELRPGTLTLVDVGDEAALAEALRLAHDDPARTRLPAGTPLRPALDDVAAAYESWWATLPAVRL